jgi:hypothetical protein
LSFTEVSGYAHKLSERRPEFVVRDVRGKHESLDIRLGAFYRGFVRSYGLLELIGEERLTFLVVDCGAYRVGGELCGGGPGDAVRYRGRCRPLCLGLAESRQVFLGFAERFS